MPGLDLIKVAIVGGLILAVLTTGITVYHGIQAAELAKIELQQAKLVAAAQHEQDQRSIDALQTKADLAAALAVRVDQLKDALHAVPISHSCLASPAGAAFTRWLHDTSGLAGAPAQAPAQSMAVPGPAAAAH